MTGLETELKDFRTEVFHKFDILGAKFESSQKKMGHTVESSLKEMANSRTSYPQSRMNNKRSSNFYARGFFGVSLILHTICQFLA
jgi:hypothetical protein